LLRDVPREKAFPQFGCLHGGGHPKSHEGLVTGVPGAGLPYGEIKMSPYYRFPDELEKTLGHQETGYDASEWQRWDEELVEDLGRWLSRIAKAFAIVLLVGSCLIVVVWLWGKF
jgi:hypothetical protein